MMAPQPRFVRYAMSPLALAALLLVTARVGPGVAAAESRTVTLADDGQTIELAVGERFLLALGGGYDWTATVADQAVVSRVVNVTIVLGAQGLYEANRPGTTVLQATGDLPCRQSRPSCAAPSRLFRVALAVRGGTPLPGLPNTGAGATATERDGLPREALMLPLLALAMAVALLGRRLSTRWRVVG